MTAYKKNLLAWALIMAVGVALGLAAVYVTSWFLVPFFAVVVSVRFVLNRITCPNCGTPVTYQGEFRGIAIWGGFIRRHCQKCGFDLNQQRGLGIRS